MNFKLERDDQIIIDEAAKLFRQTFPLSRFRESPDTFLNRWPDIFDAGWVQARVGEPAGMGLPLYVIAGIAREAGRQLLVESFVNNVMILAQLFTQAADDAIRDDLMNRLRVQPGFLITNGRGSSLFCDPSDVVPWVFGARRQGPAMFLRGGEDQAELVLLHGVVDLYPMAEGAGIEEVGWIPVGGLNRSRTVRLHASPGWHERLVRDAMVAHAASLTGVAEEAIHQTVEYVKVRQQFGRTLGEFQSIQHALADLRARVEVAWLGTLRAAVSESAVDALAAHIGASVAAIEASKAMVQFHGGIGFTWDHVSHRFLKAAYTGANRFGSPEIKATQLGRQILGVTGGRERSGS